MKNECPKCQTENTSDSRFCKKCATSLPHDVEITESFTKTSETPTEELTTGSTFAKRYQIIEELGKGGMGRVYRVLDKKLNEEVALKLIRPDIAADKKTIERFKNELKLARKIRQKNVGSMYELLEEQSVHFITMEYISGQDLKGLIRQTGQLTVGKAVSIAKQICDGLEEAHSMGIVHRDLKPNNIMIDRGGNARIMDFGIARAMKGKSITGYGVMIGTPQYMSPEQVEGKEVDQRSDIYSLGIILYEMLTDRVPFEGDTALTVGVKQRTETPKDPKDFNEQIPDNLNQLILKCLEKEREKRYQSADDVRSDLERLEQGLPSTDRVVPKTKTHISKEITVTFGRRWIIIAASFAIVLLAVLAIVFLTKKEGTSLKDKKMIVVLPFENLGSEEDEYFADGIADEISSRLASLDNLGVISRSSTKRYKNTEKTIKEIGKELGVNFVLWGTVRWNMNPRGKGRVQVTPELIRVSDEIIIWSNRYTREIEDIWSVQSEIAEKVILALGATLLDMEK